MTPQRIRLSRAKGWRLPDNTVKVDRSTPWGNPFPVQKCKAAAGGKTCDEWQVGTWTGPAMWLRPTLPEAQDLSVLAFRAWTAHPAQSRLLERARLALRGQNLACWCVLGAPCHADVWLEIANGPRCEAAS